MDVIIDLINIIICFLNANATRLSVVCSFGMLILTIIIAFSNAKSAEFAKKQLQESQQNYYENTRARIIVSFNCLDKNNMIFSFKNIGMNLARDVQIYVKHSGTSKSRSFTERIKKLNNSLFQIEPNGIYKIYVNPLNFENFFKTEWEFEIIYKNANQGKDIKETTKINMYDYDWQCYEINVQEELEKEKVSQLKKLNDKITILNDNIELLTYFHRDFGPNLSQTSKIFFKNLLNYINKNNLKGNTIEELEISLLNTNIENIEEKIREILLELKYHNLIAEYQNTDLNSDFFNITLTNKGIEILNKNN